MILKVGSDASQIVHHRYADGLQVFGRPDAGDLQQMRGVDGPTAQNHLTRRFQFDVAATLAEGDANAIFSLEQEFGGNGFRFDAQVGAGLGFLQEGLRCRAAPLALASHLRVAHAFLLAAVQVFAEREAGLLRCLDEAVRQRQDGTVVLDFQRAILAPVFRVVALFVGLRFAENG